MIKLAKLLVELETLNDAERFVDSKAELIKLRFVQRRRVKEFVEREPSFLRSLRGNSTQKELADAAGITNPLGVSMLERGDTATMNCSNMLKLLREYARRAVALMENRPCSNES